MIYKLILSILILSSNLFADENYTSINDILLSNNASLEHQVLNKINQNFEISHGYINRTNAVTEIVMTKPSNETYSLHDSYIEYCDIDFNECSIINSPQIINSPFFKIIKTGLREIDNIKDILIFDENIELRENAIKINKAENLIEISYLDSIGALNKIKINKI